jgi:predicted negative regulator of RcsB-dependent stress response
MVGLRGKLVNAVVATKRSCGIRALVWAFVLSAVSLGLCFIPLYNLLGYDSAFAIGLVAAFASVDIGQGRVHGTRLHARSPAERSVWAIAVRATACSLAILLPPIAILCLNALRVPNCNLATGFAFFALLPVATACFATPMGVAAGIISIKRGRLWAFALPFLSIAWAAVRMFVDPPVYAFDPFGGYFPGPIYDEALTPPLRLLYFRLANLLWAITALLVLDVFTSVRGNQSPRFNLRELGKGKRMGIVTLPRVCTLFACLLAAVFVFESSETLGFHRSEASVRESLSRTSTTEHFQVFSNPADGQTPKELATFLTELEFRHKQLTEILKTQPHSLIRVFLFPNADAKKDLVGAGATLFAKPWRREIFLQVDDFPPNHLRHEMAHVFAGSFGDPVFGISLRWLPWPQLASGLVEGIAEAADFTDPQGPSTIHQDARALVDDRKAPPLEKIMGAGFSIAAGPSAYTLAASFSHYLMAHEGAEKFATLYRSGGDFQGVYSRSLAQLEAEWKSFLVTQPLDADQKNAAKELFRRPAIFKKVCARELAARIQEASRLRSHDPEKAVQILSSVCDDDPNEPSYKLSLAYAQAAAKRTDEALSTLNALIQKGELTRPMQRRIASFKANLAIANGKTDEAIDAETTAFKLAAEESERRSSVAKLRALSDPRALPTLGRVLFGDSPTESLDSGLAVHLLNQFSRDYPQEALGSYLLGRQLVSRDPVLAFTTLQQACPEEGDAGVNPLTTPLPPLFVRECLRMLGQSAYLAGAYENARAAWLQSLRLANSEAERLRAADFLERINWVQKHQLHN